MMNHNMCTWLVAVSGLTVGPFCLVACSSSSEPVPEQLGDAGTGGTGTGGGAVGPTAGGTTSGMASTSTSQAVTTVGTTATTSGASASTTGTMTSAASGVSNSTSGASSMSSTGTGGSAATGTTVGTETSTATSGGSDGPAPTAPDPSTGCEAATTAPPCDSSGSPCVLDVDGTEREFYVVLPDDYDPTRPYPVVFQFHPLGGSAEQGMNMYGVRPNFADAIYVTPQGLISLGSNPGFANENGQDEAMTRAIMADIEAKYCVDRSRYFSTGFSYGGSMSYTAACNMSDVFRAVAAMAGAPISGARCASEAPANRVAVWGSHGSMDTALPVDMAIPIRDAWIERNGCSTETVPVDPSPCVEYQGCDDGYPVVWCLVEGQGHAIPDYGPTAIAEFFQRF